MSLKSKADAFLGEKQNIEYDIENSETNIISYFENEVGPALIIYSDHIVTSQSL